MSGFIAVVTPDERQLVDPALARMVAALEPRGNRAEIWRGAGVAMAVARFDWELVDGFAGAGLVAHDGDVTVAADATLYYQAELERKLRGEGVNPRGNTTAHLIAAAYRAWGTECPRHLEGDYAFVVYDGARDRTFAARDFMGRRPLYYARVGETLLIASTVSAIVAHASCPLDLDDLAIGELVGVSLAGHDRTPYAAIRVLPPATLLASDGAAAPRTSGYWHLPTDDAADARSFEAAAELLGELLAAAIIERHSPVGPTAIWLSGGYDSPVMYGVGNAALDRRGLDRLRAISFSHPPGDPAREDELIAEVTRFWDASPTWLSIEDVPLLEHAAAHAAAADVPFQHAFENWLRALLRATAEQGARVALYGDGGDQLFAVSMVFLRDLFAGVRWRSLRREWRALGGGGARALWQSVAHPVIDERLRAVRGDRAPRIGFPSWLQADFVRRHGLEARQAEAERTLAAGGGGRAGAETRRSLTNPTVPRVLAGFSSLALEHAVELRAPLLDRRIVEFALQRPRAERASAGAVKHLLRRTATGLLPPNILAPRKEKTGVLTGYFARSFRADAGGMVSDAFAAPVLAEMGIVDAAALQQAWRDYKSGREGKGGYLLTTFQTELWLRARLPAPARTGDIAPEWIRMPAAGIVQC